MPDDSSFAAELRDAPLADALGERYLAYALSTVISPSPVARRRKLPCPIL